jgi:hypothetical protein
MIKYSHESSLNSFADHRLSQRSSSMLSNGIIIKVSSLFYSSFSID